MRQDRLTAEIMLGGKFGIPELLIISTILIFFGFLVAGIWLTRESKRSSTGEIPRPSKILVALGFIWSWLVFAAMWNYPLLSTHTFGGVLSVLSSALRQASVVSLLLALIVWLYGFGKHKNFRRWTIFNERKERLSLFGADAMPQVSPYNRNFNIFSRWFFWSIFVLSLVMKWDILLFWIRSGVLSLR